MIRRGCGLVLLVALGCATPTAAQTPQDQQALIFWKGRAAQIVERRKTVTTGLVQDIEDLISVQNLLPNFLLYLDEQRRRDFDLRLVEDARTDKQVGSPASQPGGTNLVSKGSVPSIFGFAVENGALTPSQTGTVVTLRGGLIGWLDLVKNQGFIGAYERDSRFVRALRRVSYSISLDTSTAVETTETRPGLGAIKASLEDAGRQVAGYSVRFAIYDRRDPRRAENRAAANKLLSESQVLPSTDFLDDFFVKPEYRQWREASAKILASPDLAEVDVERVLFDRLEKIAQMMRAMVPEFEAQVTGVILALDAYDRARVAVFEAIHERPVFALEYVRARPVSLPDRSTIRFIAEGQFGAWDTTANAAWTYQHEGVVFVPEETTIGGYRDFQIAAQLERALGSVRDCIARDTGIGRPVVGIAFLSQRLSQTATVTFAGHDFEVEPGWIHVLQAMVTIPVKGSGVKMPLSVSFANRTELIKEKNVRAHVGLTFDLDVLTAGFLRR